MPAGLSGGGSSASGLPRQALLDVLATPRYEVIPLDGIDEAVAERVPKDVKVTVTVSPTKGLEPTLALAGRLAAHGYRVVPHVSARLVAAESHLASILQRLRELNVREVFVVAGDAKHAVGPYEGAAALLAAMHQLEHGLEAIGITGYPESHPFISEQAVADAMVAKAPFASYIVSQVAFDARVIASWVDRVRRAGMQLPIHVGVPGRVDRQKLVRISTRIGVGESLRFVRGHRDWAARLFLPGAFSPDRLLAQLGPSFADREQRVVGIHVYTFNAVAETERWRREAIERLSA